MHRGVDLSTHASVTKYLKSLGLDPKGFVIQRGQHNYAGPTCPGVRWTCTTAKHVVQIMATNAPSGGSSNQFTCTPSSSTGPNDCLIVQSSTGTDNNATCVEKIGDPTGTQNCDVYQLNTTGANNVYVQQQISQAGVDTLTTPGTAAQSATQYTEVGQWNGSGSNTVQVNQDLKQSQAASLPKTGSIIQQQDGHQTASVSQHSDSGNNTAKVLQSLQLKASATGGTSITQRQDTNDGPNSNAAIYQNSDQDALATPTSTGTNSAYLFQSNDLNASGAKTGSLTQQQGADPTGLNAYVDQRSTGVSTSQGNQNEHQSLGASQVTGTLSQTQIGPEWYDPNQANNPADTFTASQSSDQNAGPRAEQDDQEYAECGSSGRCALTEKVSNDHQNATNSCTDSSCDISLIAVGGSEPYVNKCTEDCGFEAPPPPPDPLGEGGNFCEFISTGPCAPLTPTTTALAQDSTTSVPLCNVALTATVGPAGATGDVQFYINGTTPLGSPVTLGPGGTVTTNWTPLSAFGTVSLTATYLGDATHASSTSSPALSHTVNPGTCTSTTTALAQDSPTTGIGCPVTLTATVAPAGATGTVEFLKDGVPIPGPPLALPPSGIVSITWNQPFADTDTFTARYSGDGTHATSISAPVTHTWSGACIT